MVELQERFQARYKGRKGRKRLKEVQESIEQMHRETGGWYDDTEEMKGLEDLMPDPEVRLYFLKYFRDLDAMWNGVESYGFLRLCGKWTRQNQVLELDQPNIDAMLESILPSKEWKLLTEGPEPEQGPAAPGTPAGSAAPAGNTSPAAK